MARLVLLTAIQVASALGLAFQSDHAPKEKEKPKNFQGVMLVGSEDAQAPVEPIYPDMSDAGGRPVVPAAPRPLVTAAPEPPIATPGPIFMSPPGGSKPRPQGGSEARPQGGNQVPPLELHGKRSNLSRNAFADVLGFHGHKGHGVFSDLGAWHGFGLPDKGFAGGFAGPYVHGQFVKGHWISPSTLVRFAPLASTVQQGVPHERRVEDGMVQLRYVPGALRQEYTSGDFQIASELIFIGPRTAAVRVRMLNAGQDISRVVVQFNGSASVPLQTDHLRKVILASVADNPAGPKPTPAPSEDDEEVEEAEEAAPSHKPTPLSGASVQAEVRFDPALNITTRIGLHGYMAKSMNETVLAPEEEGIAYYTVSLTMNYKEMLDARAVSESFFRSPSEYFINNRKRWEGYMDSVVGDIDQEPTLPQRVATKAVCTLLCNWRGATGEHKHDGLVPSMTGYNNGMWSWDSWKHAAALALIDPALAAHQIQALFDHQGKEVEEYRGMIPDKVGLPPDHGDGWGNTKPPLSAWAVWQVYFHGQDKEFLKDMFPKLERYHNWWYKHRDHDGNGLCEYGSTSRNTEQMKWESGMDNAPRFDKTQLLQNSAHAFSANQESVDLNSYLYAEKRMLGIMAKELGFKTKASTYAVQAKELRRAVQERFFDQRRGYFFDRRVGRSSAFVGPMGCEGFIPLWAGLASQKQAERVREHLLNANRFNTKVPFPCVAANEPEFKDTGYWRGPVWLDQAYFALHGLRRYGFEGDADTALNQLLTNAEGLGSGDPSAPFSENYNPLTGKRQGIEFFGWSAAHMLLLTAAERKVEDASDDIEEASGSPDGMESDADDEAEEEEPAEPEVDEPEEPQFHH